MIQPVVKPVVKPVLQPGLTTGWMFVYTIQPVVKPLVQPVRQPVVSCKRGFRVFTARRHASTVYVVFVCLSVCLSVCLLKFFHIANFFLYIKNSGLNITLRDSG